MAQQNDTQTPIDDDLDGEGGLSVHDAASRIEGLLSDEDLGITAVASAAKPRKPAKPSTPDNEDDDHAEVEEDLDEGADSHVDDDEEDDDSAAEVDEDEDPANKNDDDDDEEDDDAPAPPSGRKFTTKVDGEPVEVTLQEALAGYSRTASFTKKSQALAEERRAFEAARVAKEAEISAAQEHYANQLSALEAALSSQEPDWEAVRRDNPEQFAEMHAAWQIDSKRLERIRDERAATEAKLQAKNLENLSTTVRAERDKLIAVIPEWGDKSDKGKTFRNAIRDFGVSQGFSAQELEGVADHRAFVILHKAFLYDQAQAKKKADVAKGKKKVEQLPTVKPGVKPGKHAGKRSNAAQAAARLKKTGNVRDAAAAIEALLE